MLTRSFAPNQVIGSQTQEIFRRKVERFYSGRWVARLLLRVLGEEVCGVLTGT